MAEKKLKLQPFMVPNYVIAEMSPRPKQDGILSPLAETLMPRQEAPKWELREIDADSLSELCDEFRAAVFAKAQQPDPRKD